MITSESINALISAVTQSVTQFLPETALIVTFIIAILFDIIFKKTKNITAYVSIAGFVITGILLLFQGSNASNAIFSKMLSIDSFGQFFKFIILGSGIFVMLMSLLSKELYKDNRKVGEYYTLIVGMTIGMFIMSSATNLIMIYLALETMSISSYILAGYTKEMKRASEASLKYVIYGATSSAIMIYGMSLLFGLTGSLNLDEINLVIQSGVDLAPLLIAGLMIVVGIGYKISAVPFHFWTPDVYEGAPVTITALLSVASKAAGFALLIRFFHLTLANSRIVADPSWSVLTSIDWKMIIAILSVLSMTVGNLTAIWQTNIKRMLAYSSISHAGFMLMGVVVMNDIGVAAVMMYFFVYIIMNLGAFLIVMFVADKTGSEELDDYAGLGYRSPFLAVCLSIFLVSLAGLPPTAGFIGKLYVFTAVLNSNYVWLAVVGIINSVIALFYYANVFRNMFMRNMDTTESKFSVSRSGVALVLLTVIPTLVFGIWWSPIAAWAKHSVAMFLFK